MRPPVHVIGAGLAGCEAAWQLAQAGIKVVLHEMRPQTMTPAHRSGGLAELVCSNSLRSDDPESSAIGLLHEEMRKAGSLILAAADRTRVPAGGALAVDRLAFSAEIEQSIASQPLITLVREEITTLSPEWQSVIIASGPLTSPPLAQAIRALTGEDGLAFFDAIAPIVVKDSIDFSKAWFQSRYDKGDGQDYINCPLSRDEYDAFIAALLAADTVDFHEWEKDVPFFEGCLPIEVMARRGAETLRFGPMKPVGLTNPHGPKPYAVIQLRQDNRQGTLYNMVGFQTKLRHGEQARIFRAIPGLETAEFARMGGMHKNTFVNGPKVLDSELRLKADRRIRLAGQISGCEGYVESASIGLLAGLFAREAKISAPPLTTALGALFGHVTGQTLAETYQPMNVTFGLFAPPPDRDEKGKRLKGKDRKAYQAARGRRDFQDWLVGITPSSPITRPSLP